MDKICITKNAITGKTNDANDYGNEVKNNPSYSQELLQRIISISVKSIQSKQKNKSNPSDLENKLEEINSLLDRNIINEEEYKSIRKKILGI